MPKVTKDATYSPREINNLLRNAVIAAARPRSGPFEDPVRLRQIRKFSTQLIEYLEEVLDEGYLKSGDELALAIVSAAWVAHTKHVLKD